LREHERSASVAEVVKTHARETGICEDTLEGARDVGSTKRRPVTGRENEPQAVPLFTEQLQLRTRSNDK
jgi:hypothetical protein